ncbi:MAG: hypothetical protein ACE5DQ_02105, partial [Candidatus Paceibacterota bacterium]
LKKLQSLQVPLAVILALVFVTLRWYFNFARFAFEATYLIFLELISLYFILRAVRSKNLHEIALSAIFAGLAYNSYVVGRMFFVVPLFYLIVFYLGGVDKRHLRGADNSRYKTPEVIRRVFYFLIPFLIVIAPLTLYFSQNPDIRVSQQLYFLDPNLELPQKISFFFSNIWENMKMFIVSGAGDANGRHNYPFKPALNPVIFILFIAGLLSALKNWKHRYNSVFLVYFLVGFFPTILTYPHENPNMLRTVTILPSVVYLVGLAIQASYNFITRLSLKPPLRWTHSKFVKILPLFLLISILLGLVGSSLYEFRTYFIFQKLVFEEAFDVRDGLERVHELRPPQ